ncbi:ankyrin repeat and SAM domain-containing protein 1A [Daktulosphaira vitifoliae]|uniref:ankyrin repeat and SAM domain-containing protein 1A n=1 Tax=Daktulosphaira vitifoliae TaxID=58002 RepID=UPI0021A9EC19|nr:ankyrin repeat and SAM domain-containing protein 1A [Daktulosphaira vitifoliae]
MGKDQDLVIAAKTGNLSAVEKILVQKAKRTGPLASLRRGAGVNTQDQSGFTALHHASLNAYKEIVQLLLCNEASTNVVDHKGAAPLHLAAWTGNVDIVRLLLCHGPSIPNVNHMTKNRETPLHCAAQYGHSGVVALLIEHGADPTIRNHKHETALDLCAQYGRFETVELIITKRPELIRSYNSRAAGIMFAHTPLHLASRNGHKTVVELLLDAGMDVNVRTGSGTALHEAAQCGKTEVARLLLDHGVNTHIRDIHRRTVEDLLKQFPSKAGPAVEISAMLQNHQFNNNYESDMEPDKRSENSEPVPLNSPYDGMLSPSPSPTRWEMYKNRRVSESSAFSSDGHYLTGRGYKSGPPTALSRSLIESNFLSGPELDTVSISSSTASSGHRPTSSSFYLPMAPSSPATSNISPMTSKRLIPETDSPLRVSATNSGGPYEYLYFATSGSPSSDINRRNDTMRRGVSADHYVDMELRPKLSEEPVALMSIYQNVPMRTTNPRRKLKRHDKDPGAILSRGDLQFKRVELEPATLNQVVISDRNGFITTTISSSKESLLDNANTPSADWPLSPTHYVQPPTPDHPPPSPFQAERSIHARIRPLSQEYINLKRKSRDMETETEEDLLVVSWEPVSQVSFYDKSVSTSEETSVEEFVGDATFAGLLKGSVNVNRAERPKTLRKLRTVYDPPVLAKSPGSVDDQSKNSSKDILSPFDEQEEWAKISDLIKNLGEGNNKESMCSELEKEFQSRLGLSRSESKEKSQTDIESPTTVKSWLFGLGFGDITTKFIDYGYDNLDFICGVLIEADLKEMGIENENDRSKILEAANDLPRLVKDFWFTNCSKNASEVKSKSIDDLDAIENEESSKKVEQWLTSIGLPCYIDTFRKHLYIDLERIARIWEVELTSVLEIHKPGHRRRILSSVENTKSQLHQAVSVGDGLNDIGNDLVQIKKNIQSLKDKIPSKHCSQLVSGTATLRHNPKKSRHAPLPPPFQNLPSNQNNDLIIRDPSELLFGVPSTLTTQWRHQPTALVTGNVKYIASYLGSTEVKEPRGTESTKLSIQKLKQTIANGTRKSLPVVALVISYRGVRFMDPNSGASVCEHEIRNINCACQDADDLNHFAYITKDHHTSSHYSHVFSVSTMDQATEIILTLGQAFEVAYQMALKTRTASNSRAASNGHTRSHSANHVLPPSGTRESVHSNSHQHYRSHSVNEIKINGIQKDDSTGKSGR